MQGQPLWTPDRGILGVDGKALDGQAFGVEGNTLGAKLDGKAFEENRFDAKLDMDAKAFKEANLDTDGKADVGPLTSGPGLGCRV